MEIALNKGFCEIDEQETELVNGGGVGGAAIGIVLGAGIGMCVGAVKASYSGDNSDIWKTAASWAIKNGIKGAFLPY